jgi:CHAD domain-containing protein
VLGALLAREARRAVVRASGVDATSAAVQLHAVRRAGRRVRYAAEALAEVAGDVFGAPERRLAAAGERIQDVLGDHRDQVLFAEYLRRSSAGEARSEQERAVLERLAVAAQGRAVARISELDSAVRELRRAERHVLSL